MKQKAQLGQWVKIKNMWYVNKIGRVIAITKYDRRCKKNILYTISIGKKFDSWNSLQLNSSGFDNITADEVMVEEL